MTSKPSDAIAHLLREALEGTLAPNLAAAILFEALAEQEGHALPADRAGLEGFLTDRLRPALDRHLGPRRGLQILDSVRELLDAVLGAPLTPPRASQIPTAMVEPEAGPVRVLVVATKAKLANGLRGALGAAVEPYWAPNGEVVAFAPMGVVGVTWPPVIPYVMLLTQMTVMSTLRRAAWKKWLPPMAKRSPSPL